MKTALKLLLALALVLVLLAAGGFAWARGKTAESLDRTIDTHTVDFPVPFPLDSAEIARLGLEADEADALAVERALERGRHLVEARYGCAECHGASFGGGVMIDDPAIGRLLGPNITPGRGSRTVGYTTADWDRIVRHGVKPDGRPGAMPAQDFRRMSDQELSDIIVYLESTPPVDATVPPIRLGPLGTVLVATGEIPLAADLIEDHRSPHAVRPPPAGVTVEFGRHLAGICVGCHGAALSGGPIPGGDPSWPPASNLTPDADGLGAWSYDDFATALLEGRRPDGSELREPMTLVMPFARNMTETEIRALWEFLRSAPSRPTDR